MDGLMFDTEILGHLSWERTANKYNFPYSIEVAKRLIGKNYKAILSDLKKDYGEMAPVEKWIEEATEIRKQMIKENGTLGIKPGLIELLSYLKDLQIKMAVASSSKIADITHHLQHEGLSHYFDFVVGGDQVKESKPNPEIFLTPCQNLDILPENTIVLEDSYYGFLAARAAQIPVIIVPDLVEPPEHVFKEAVGVFQSLHEVKKYIRSCSVLNIG